MSTTEAYTNVLSFVITSTGATGTQATCYSNIQATSIDQQAQSLKTNGLGLIASMEVGYQRSLDSGNGQGFGGRGELKVEW